MPIMLTITGTVVSLKNSRRLVRNRRTGKPLSIKSTDAERWMRDFVIQVPAQYRGLKLGSENQLLRAVVEIWYPSLRSDVDPSIVWDALQLAGVISNDRWIREQNIYGYIDAKNPRCKILITEV